MRPALRFVTVILSLVLFAGPAFAAPHAHTHGRCPYGHSDVVSVPIFYGYPVFTPELKKALDRGEIILGGCEVGEGSPKEAVFCRRCGFRLLKTKEGDVWWRISEDFESFEIPLPAFFAELTRTFEKEIRKAKRADPEDAPRFEQSVRGGIAVKEYAGIIVGDNDRRVIPVVRRILAAHSVRVTPHKLEPGAPSSFEAGLGDGTHEGRIAITHSWEDRTIVAITWKRKAPPR